VTAIIRTRELLRRAAGEIGGGVRGRAAFVLALAALAAGVVAEALRPGSWRRSVRASCRLGLRRTIGGGLPTTLTTAGLIGFAMVFEAIYWLGIVGQDALVGPVLVTVLVREVAPVLVGLILLGRNGTVILAEFGAMQAGGQFRALDAQGLDPFMLLVLPFAVASATACFTLGVIFVLAALGTGFVAANVFSTVQKSFPGFLEDVLAAMSARDFAIFPAKMLGIGMLVALVACLTGLSAGPDDDAAVLLPRGFVRGVLTILLTSLVLSMAA